ncbi:MAG: alpha-glucosidase [Solirubrobacteraceae bacterium]|nr:alpha-glucosidase [Solirubrobacteraceae bacterium]
MGTWWQDAVVYQVYPRSFQDSDGDGEGDLPGVAARLDHVRWLGADGVWLSPFYPSPLADGGYDVADFLAVDRRFGTLDDFDALVSASHDRGLRVLMDLVPCHTSIEHPWFREHPDRYIWSPTDGPANNWIAAFGGAAWSRDPLTGRWYLHSFYPEQPDLDWRNPDVGEAMGDVLRFWLGRGVDGFRLDAIDRVLKDSELRDDPVAQRPPPLPLIAEHGTLEHVHSRNAPDIGAALATLRGAAGDALLVGEVYLPTAELAAYLDHLDAAFCFELLHARWDAAALRSALEAALAVEGHAGRMAWVLSNHDFHRLPNRVGLGNVRAAALLLLTLPGAVFVYQGDEIGMADGPEGDPPRDRAGRDPYRNPMQWEPLAGGGFTEGDPWLPLADPLARNVADQHADSESLLWLYRDLIALRPALGPRLVFADDAQDGVLVYERGDHTVAINLAQVTRRVDLDGVIVRGTHSRELAAGAPAPASLEPGRGVVVR